VRQRRGRARRPPLAPFRQDGSTTGRRGRDPRCQDALSFLSHGTRGLLATDDAGPTLWPGRGSGPRRRPAAGRAAGNRGTHLPGPAGGVVVEHLAGAQTPQVVVVVRAGRAQRAHMAAAICTAALPTPPAARRPRSGPTALGSGQPVPRGLRRCRRLTARVMAPDRSHPDTTGQGQPAAAPPGRPEPGHSGRSEPGWHGGQRTCLMHQRTGSKPPRSTAAHRPASSVLSWPMPLGGAADACHDSVLDVGLLLGRQRVEILVD